MNSIKIICFRRIDSSFAARCELRIYTFDELDVRRRLREEKINE